MIGRCGAARSNPTRRVSAATMIAAVKADSSDITIASNAHDDVVPLAVQA